jgi:NAD(P)-dependent dehydrogenase (short-subunit alcohol dehydrogenase family)
MEQALQGKVALVTGGSRNIGRHAAIALAKRGADVVISYQTQQKLADAVVSELEALGVRARALSVNLTGTGELAAFEQSFRGVLSQWSRADFDILVNNAGTLRLGTFDAVTEADVEHNYLTNYKSLFFLTQRLSPLLRDGGRIVNLGSGTARIAFTPLVSYGPFKAAVQSLTLYLAAHFGPRNITVNAVAPGGLDDDFNKGLFEWMPPSREFIRSNTAIGRMGGPSDVGEVIGFLCSPEASFISGAVVPIDGGFHL